MEKIDRIKISLSIIFLGLLFFVETSFAMDLSSLPVADKNAMVAQLKNEYYNYFLQNIGQQVDAAKLSEYKPLLAPNGFYASYQNMHNKPYAGNRFYPSQDTVNQLQQKVNQTNMTLQSLQASIANLVNNVGNFTHIDSIKAQAYTDAVQAYKEQQSAQRLQAKNQIVEQEMTKRQQDAALNQRRAANIAAREEQKQIPITSKYSSSAANDYFNKINAQRAAAQKLGQEKNSNDLLSPTSITDERL